MKELLKTKISEQFGISKSEFRRLINQGSVYIRYEHPEWDKGWQKVDLDFEINELAQPIMKVGKRKFLKLNYGFTYKKI